MQSGIYEGTVRHRRFEPVRHEFRVPLFMMYLDLNELPIVFQGRWFWSIENWNVATFRRRDHFGDTSQPLDESVRNLVENQTGHRPGGPIRLLTHLSYFGYCFNPLSVFFCFDESGNHIQSVVAEVTNTPWRERHCYVLPVVDAKQNCLAASSGEPEKLKFRFAKSFHVSPFMAMDFEYRWNLVGPGDQLVLQAENWRSEQASFDATLNLKRQEITTWSLARVLVLYPLMTAQVMAKIYWQALRLWWKRIPYVPHPVSFRLDEPDKIHQTKTPTQDSIQN
jgi:DUF1365 family protein